MKLTIFLDDDNHSNDKNDRNSRKERQTETQHSKCTFCPPPSSLFDHLYRSTMSQASEASRKRKADDAVQEDDKQEENVACPYLDTIQRSLLDFDQEPACSVSLQTGPHIYCCLVCGKFFRGRGPQTPAYTHSVEESHFVFGHADKGTFHCLPDDYEIHDPSLNDIRDAMHPTYTAQQIKVMDQTANLSRDLFGAKYLPGFVGLNNHGKTDAINAVIQALAHVQPLRDYFLAKTHHVDTVATATDNKKVMGISSNRLALQVTSAFGMLVRKMWSDTRFKSTVDPHMMVQAISAASNKRFRIGQQAEVGELMAWLLHQLHLGTGGKRKPGSSIIHKVFQGKVRVTTRQAKAKEDTNSSQAEQDDRLGSDDEDDGQDQMMEQAADEPEMVVEETTADTHFLQLTLDIPEKPLFRDADGGLVIPQEPLVNVLKKFDGTTLTDALSRNGASQRKSYKLLKLPSHLILHLGRFKQNGYTREKNPTIVAFPVKNFDLSAYVHHEKERPKPPTEEQVRNMSVRFGESIRGRCASFKGLINLTFCCFVMTRR